MLHITNGDSAGYGICQTGIPGEVLAWKDILHEGPVPANLSLNELSEVRARFIADRYALPLADVTSDFNQRDEMLARYGEHEEVVLWFEHDLYDQLQLIQILDWFAHHDLRATKLSLICIGAFAGIEHFMGLGQLTPTQLAPLFDTRCSVTQPMLQAGSTAWQAFCAPTPIAIEALLKTDSATFPFLNQALHRHLEEYPSTNNGLSRTERQILEVVLAEIHTPAQIFRATLEKEESAFMGDMTFWTYLSMLCASPKPLLTRADGSSFFYPARAEYNEAFHEQALVITQDGHAVLDSDVDWIRLKGGIDRWLGGTHLHGQDAAWRWDGQQRVLVK